MALPNSVEALVNERTGKYFIVVDWDGGEEGKVKVINPIGDILDVPTVIFKIDEPKSISQADFVSKFTPEQIAKLERWEQERFAIDEKKRLERAARSSQASSSSKATAPRARPGSSRRDGIIDKSTSSVGRRPTVQWSSDKLVFYRHKIEGLKPNDVFAVVIEGHGPFQMSKAEFQRKFNNIIMSPEYRGHGIHRYDVIPDEALPFITK
jgi:hypothetical protein